MKLLLENQHNFYHVDFKVVDSCASKTLLLAFIIAFNFGGMVLFIASSGAAAGGIIFFLAYIPYFFIQQRLDQLSVGARVGASLLSNVAMALGCVQISMYEGTGVCPIHSQNKVDSNLDEKIAVHKVSKHMM